jgi:hypothetical protein
MVESLPDDVQFVTVNGAWTKTRADYLDLMQRLHGGNGPFRSSTCETPEMHVRFLAPDVAMMHSKFHIHGDLEEPERTCIDTRVVRKSNGRRRTVAVQNTDVRPGRRHEAASNLWLPAPMTRRPPRPMTLGNMRAMVDHDGYVVCCVCWVSDACGAHRDRSDCETMGRLMRRKLEPGPPMTLGNMHELRVL